MPRKAETRILFRPLKDFCWNKPRKSRLGWESTKIGGVVVCHGSPSNIREMIFKAMVQNDLDWTWELQRIPDEDAVAPCFRCTRIA